MNQQLVVNNFTGYLKNPLALNATTATLSPTGIGSKLPALANGDFVILTVSADVEPSKETQRYALKVTAVTGDTITFEPSGEVWPAGSRVQSRLGAALVNSLTEKNVAATVTNDGYMTKELVGQIADAHDVAMAASEAAQEVGDAVVILQQKNVSATDTRDGYMTKEDHALLSASANGTPRTLTASANIIKADNNGLITYNSASAGVLTITNDTTGGWSGNETISVLQYGIGAMSFAAGSGVTLRTPSGLPASTQYGFIAATRIAANEWVLV